MKKIIKSAFLVVAIAAVAGYATYSFFSDTETSTGNTFTAGAIDLKIDNTSYVSNKTTGALEASTTTTWTAKDLDVEKFFNFSDLKPGDIGEDTISFTVNSNPAWVCAEINMTSNKDNNCTEPEIADDQTDCTDPNVGGELADQINFMWWPDDGDNVLESDEVDNAFFLGPKSIQFLMDQGTTGNPDNDKLELTLADKHVNFFSKTAPGTPINPNQTYYIGKGWCFGTMAPAAVAQDSLNTHGPLFDMGGGILRGTGFTCDGSQVNNAAQTDSLTADLKFTAIQSRNNMNFHCPDDFHANTP